MSNLRKVIKSIIYAYNNMWNLIVLKIKKVKVGRNLHINGKLFIYGVNGRFALGNDVTINSGKRFNPIGGDTRSIFSVGKNGNIIIGNRSGLSNTAIISYDKVTIGNNVLIGGSCKIYDTDFHSLNYEKRMLLSLDPDIKTIPVIIKDGAFIGAHSIILKGVTIGERSIVGAGSVVTKSIPNGEIWAGNPAKLIRKI